MKTNTNDNTTNGTHTRTSGVINRLENLNQKMQNAFAAFQEKVKPVAEIGTIIAAVYSVIAVIALLLSLTGSNFGDVLLDSQVFGIIFNILLVGAMVGLFTTGGILTALQVFLKAAGTIFGRGQIFSVGDIGGFFISLAVNLAITVVALIFVALALFVAPIVPILMHQRKCGA